ncbi:MAG: multiple sugar transport system substrate-binding protein [Acidobacteriota bacterium]|jgi:multiple sugar transport system substrate-binding protein|nr:multiple sugar transport system substrate-binding protein [Acidobacteriota bacterium]
MGLLLTASLASCAPRADTADTGVTLRFWALGREGEVVKDLIPEFERRNPGIRVDVQQIPFLNAHEKLLTACVGGVTPDLAQVGNTWIPELANLEAIARLDEQVSRSSVIAQMDYFPGIWDTNVVDGFVRGIPWYVDTRLLFYRTDLLAAAGFPEPPRTWSQWLEAMRRVKSRGGPGRFAILLPVDEHEQPVILGRELGAGLLRDGDRYGDFRSPAFRQAAGFYVGLFRSGLAPAWSNSQIVSVYQQFAAGDYAFYITGPWNVGEFRRRLPADMQDKWKTAPMPAPDNSRDWPGVSVAGGASLVLFRASRHPEEVWKLIEFLSAPAMQVRFHELTGDLPSRATSWASPSLAGDPQTAAFRAQLERVVPAPKVPEWEEITVQIWQSLEPAIRGRTTVDAALTDLDKRVDRILAKRRQVLERRRPHG